MRRYLAALIFTAMLIPLVIIPPDSAQAFKKVQAPDGQLLLPNLIDDTGETRFSKPTGAQAQMQPISRRAVGFAVSPPLRDLPDAPPLSKEASAKVGEEDHEVNEKNREFIRRANPFAPHEPDGALQQSLVNTPTVLPTPSLVFDGNSNTDNANLFGFRLSPPDTEGDVGPNHYVQVINLTIRIFDKAGAALIPARKFSSVFTALGAPCGDEDGGDPIALYDPMADRWLLSQFCFPFGDTTPPFFETIAISQTPDPTGAYYLYNFNVSAGNNEFPDYPHLGVWPDGYYMTTNQFLNGDAFDGGGMFAFDRQKMLIGDPSASFIYFNRSLANFPEAQAGMLPADMDGVRPPPPGTPCPFAYFTANEFGDPADGVRMFDFHADFATPANSTFTERPESAAVPGGGIPVAAFDPSSPTGRDDVPQPAPASNTTARLDSISDRLMHRLQYINFGSYESLVVTNTVNVGPDVTLANYRAGIRYYQFRKNPGVNPYTVAEQATWAGLGGDTVHRWMGSAAMNAAGDLAVGYSASSSSVFPSIRYAARFAADPPGGLAQGEQTMFAGTGVQTDTGSRWGDYSALSVDPSDDCSFWYTTETYTAASQATSGVGWLTKVGKFNLGSPCTPFPKGMISGTVTNCATGLPVANAVVKTSDGFFTTTNASGQYTLPKMTPTTYTVTASKAGFSTATANNVTVTNGNTTTQNLCIVPVNIISNGNSNIISAGANGVLDPGETVTVSLGVTNTGGPGACTTALMGTLQATGGVTNIQPPNPQNYGAMCAGDPAVFRNFTFTVDPNLACGAPVTLTLNLQDGATPYGPLTYNFVAGFSGSATNFSYTGPPVAIPDNNAAGVNVQVVVSGLTGNLGDFNFRVDGSSCNATIGGTTNGIDHTWVGDLIIKVTSPQGTTVTVFDRPGQPTTINGFNGNNICQMLLDDEGGFPSVEGVAAEPVTGNFSPNNPMSAFDGQNPNGTWTINVSDLAGFDTGSVRALTLQIATFACQAQLAPVRAPFDFDGDNKSDLSHFNGTTGLWDAVQSSLPNGSHVQRFWGAFSLGDRLVPADYDGDGKTDFAVYRSGTWYISKNSGGDLTIPWGNATDIPAPADFDGDNKADIVVYRPTEGASQGLWYVLKSSSNFTTYDVAVFGASGDKPVAGDYNADGKADYAVIRRAGGTMTWFIRYNGLPASFVATTWGLATGDIAVPGDYDGDRINDLAVWRPSDGKWYVLMSGDGYIGPIWGLSGDIPTPADYDGDGKTDFAVYRPSDHTWYTLTLSQAVSVITFGGANDTPVPAAYNR